MPQRKHIWISAENGNVAEVHEKSIKLLQIPEHDDHLFRWDVDSFARAIGMGIHRLNLKNPLTQDIIGSIADT